MQLQITLEQKTVANNHIFSFPSLLRSATLPALMAEANRREGHCKHNREETLTDIFPAPRQRRRSAHTSTRSTEECKKLLLLLDLEATVGRLVVNTRKEGIIYCKLEAYRN